MTKRKAVHLITWKNKRVAKTACGLAVRTNVKDFSDALLTEDVDRCECGNCRSSAAYRRSQRQSNVGLYRAITAEPVRHPRLPGWIGLHGQGVSK